ncbi:NAD(P)-dependent oxidoreductase [Sphingobium sp. EP60837]|uniref:NAD(P)-dependent oxidoreductase n=1 Tax=Sphingobium sp. EP60837 TaxID=1855519 RepID=UPI0007DCF393|nr:NAD(P)-dependent oxidoreductase [Sphingobium sp. EP60837]ANI80201.1 3-hydroxyisobutyrate dehydrogenase [Sphingobium sp. EP60837]
MTGQKIGFAGVGRMGAPMVRRLLEAGYEVTVFDPNAEAVSSLQERGARAALTPAELAKNSDIIFLSLPTPDIVEQVIGGENGMIEAGGERIVVDLSTTGPSVAQKMAAMLSSVGMLPVDCPVSGGVAGAERGTLALMAACANDVLPRIRPVLENLGTLTHVGEQVGMAQMLKVLNNIISVTSLAICSEALVAGVKAGLDPQIMMDVINAGSGRTNATTDKIPKYVLTRQFDFGFALGLSAKDLRLCIEETAKLGAPMAVGGAVRQMVDAAVEHLGPAADLTEIIRPLEQQAGVEVSGDRKER